MQKTANTRILAKISYALMFIANPDIDGLPEKNVRHITIQKLINQTARTLLIKSKLDKIPTVEPLKQAKFKDVNQMIIMQMLKEVWRMVNQDHHSLMNLLKPPNEKIRLKTKKVLTHSGNDGSYVKELYNSFKGNTNTRSH